MKINIIKSIKLKLLVTIFFVFRIFLIGSDFNLMPINIHFTGTVSTSKNIIVYGDNGSYLLSSDKGSMWKQYSMSNFGTIRKIINSNDTLWGIFSEGLLIRSLNHGLNWSIKENKLVVGDYFTNIVASDKYIYIRTLNEIRRFDKNFNYINSISDPILKDTLYTRTIMESLSIFSFFNKMYFDNNKLIVKCNSRNKRNGFAVIDENLSNIDTISFNIKDKIYTNQSGFSFTDFFRLKGENIFQINSNIYKTNIDLTKWQYFFKDTNFINHNDPYFSQKWPSPDYITSNFYTNSNDLFINHFTYTNKKMRVSSYGSSKGGGTVGKFGLKKYEFNGSNSSFNLYNNYFENTYYTPAVNYLEDNTPITELYYANNFYYYDSIIIKTSYFKSLLQSRDNCKTWELVSCLNGTPKLILNDSTYIFVNDNDYLNDIYRSEDYGMTFKPTEIGLDTLLNIQTRKDSTGKIDTISKSIDTLTYFQEFQKVSVFYMDNSGRSLWGAPSYLSDFKYNCAFSNDGGKRFKFTNVKNLNFGMNYTDFIASNVINVDGTYIFSISNSTKYNNKYISVIRFADTSLKSEGKWILDSLIKIQYIIAQNPAHFFMLTTSQDSLNIDRNHFQIRETTDSGKTHFAICTIERDLLIDQIYEHNKDSVFFTCSNTPNLFMYDRKRNVIDTLYKPSKNNSIKIMYLGNMFYICGQNTFLENSDRNDLTKWQPAKWDYGTPSFESVIFKGNVALAKLSDSLRPLNYYRIMVNKSSDVKEETKPEILYYTNHFYSSAPYPLPSVNSVTAKISYDMSFDLWEAIDGIYDVNGEKLEGKKNIILKNQSKAYAELVWNCASVPNGNYFIVVNHNGISDCIPVIVGK